ncbi:MAG TPA: EAL domain-containing protein [Rhodocyclaceae bacterium]
MSERKPPPPPVEKRKGLRRHDDIEPREFANLQKLLAELQVQREELERQNDELRRAESRLALHAKVFDHSAEAMIITDADNRIVEVNRAFSRLTGYAAEEVLGQDPRLLKSGRHDRDFYRELWAALASAGFWKGEIWNRRKNGEIYPEWAMISAVRNAAGETVNYFKVATDLGQHQAKEELRRLQRLDALTGLPNRMVLEDRAFEAIAHARQHNRLVALLYINIDNFRFVNESLGHLAGDEVLRTLANRFSQCVAGPNTVSRLSGDTFVILVDDLNDSIPVPQYVNEVLLSAAEAIAVGNTEVLLSACIGIALFPDDGKDFETLLGNADAALSKARENGRNTSYYFTPDLNERARRALAMAAELRRAIEQGWFVLHYQPQVDTASGTVAAVEALIRMQHPERGLIPPDEFISVAEETGMILPIGTWAMREACRQLRQWHQAGHRVAMAVNLSPMQFTDPQLFATIEAIITDEGVDPHAIELEFTEGAIMRNAKATLGVMQRLKEMGVQLTIDDFGTGYSSLNYLKQFPIDRIKIDRSFVRNLTTDPSDASIVQAIVAMSRALGVTTVAEGVETESQAGYLRSLHCDHLQGFFLGHPAPAADIEALLGSKQLVDRKAPERTLLVVDDEENLLHAIHRLLRGEGYRVLMAESGQRALDLLATNHVDVILSDQRMPGMTGTELLQKVRAMYPDVVRIILSGYSEASTITEAINKGEIYKYVTKPWDNSELVALLRKAFVRHEEITGKPRP